MSQIEENILFLQMGWRGLKAIGHERKLEVRMQKDFIGISIVAFSGYYVFGVYPHGRVATRGMQFKIDKVIRERETEFYKQLDEHFDLQWDMASQDVIFNEVGYGFNERFS